MAKNEHPVPISAHIMKNLRRIARDDKEWEIIKHEIFKTGAKIYYSDPQKTEIAGATDKKGRRIGVTTSICIHFKGKFDSSDHSKKSSYWFINKSLDDVKPIHLSRRTHSSAQAHRGKHSQNVKFGLKEVVRYMNSRKVR